MSNENKQKALEAALTQIEKQYGKGSIMKLGDTDSIEIEKFSSGIVGLDNILGGGVPKGRILEIYGPESAGKTTFALHIISEIQKNGGIAGFIDAEHALDPVYAKNIGVDIDNLYISQPDCGEQALEITETMVRSGAVDVIVVDSVAALVPKAEIDGDMGDAHVGLQARLMSQALRKLTAVINKSNCVVIFINQIREKVGVMFGCVHGDTLVNFTDGRSIPIKKVVEEEIQGKVWSYNEQSKIFEEKEIIDWHYNGDVNSKYDYIHFECDAVDSLNGITGFTITRDHKVMTKDGWKEAKDITIDDSILTKYKSIINGTLSDFLWGTFVGDSCITIRNENTACIKLQDTNQEYLEWKLNKLAPFFNFKKNGKRYESEYTSELAITKKILGRRNPLMMLKYHYSNLGLAVWFMDDGHSDFKNGHQRASISIKRFKNDKILLNEIKQELNKKGFDVTISNDANIRFTKEASNKLYNLIYKYIPKCMQYKLPEKLREKYEEFSLNNFEEYKEIFVNIRNIRICSDKQFRTKGKYDITIKDNHNYMVGSKTNGIIVHNSPETTCGGRALKFYASVRMEVRRIETIKSAGNAVANRVKVKTVKNKIAPPFKEAEFVITFGEGVSKTEDLIELAVKFDIINKAGAWYSYQGKNVAQGMEKLKIYLKENENIFEEIREQVMEKLHN